MDDKDTPNDKSVSDPQKSRPKSREDAYICAKLIASEKSVEEHGWVQETPEAMLKMLHEQTRQKGWLPEEG